MDNIKHIPKIGESCGDYWRQLQAGAKSRGLQFSISIEEAYNLFLKQNARCNLSGRILILDVQDKLKTTRTASLDRIDSSLGYISDNIQWVHKDINMAKQSLSQEKFRELCQDVACYRTDHQDNNKWDKRFLDLARYIGSFSRDPSTKVGAVITRDKKVIGLGYNGLPHGIEDTDERLNNRELKYRLVIHAEINAILNSGGSVEGCTLYTYPLGPCESCIKMVIQAGIKRVVYPAPSPEILERWADSLACSRGLAEEAGLESVEIE